MMRSTFFQHFLSFNLRNCIFKSAKKCEKTSFSMLHFDLNEAAKCADIIPDSTHIASLLFAPSLTGTKNKMATIFGLT